MRAYCRRTSLAALLLSILLFGAGALVGDEPQLSELQSEAGHFQLTWQSEIEPVPLNTMHSWILILRDAEGKAIRAARFNIDGGMPAHDHGLATRPRVTEELEDGRYRLEGLRFHMAGDWELRLDIQAGEQRDSLIVPFHLRGASPGDL